MRAFIYQKGELLLQNMPEPKPNENEVVIKLKVAGLNRRDLYIPNRVGIKKEPLILGSDGAGVIESVGKNVTRFNVGDEIIINPSLRWYDKSAFPPEGFDILGMPDHGTIAEKIVLNEEQVEAKPDNLTWEQSGVLALAALTAYRALFTQGNLQKGETVFIPGAGSGVATYLIQFANKVGAEVIVSSRSAEKRKKALEIGAHIAIDTNSDWEGQLKNKQIDLVIESVGEATFNRSLAVLKGGGNIVVFGATTGDDVEINLRELFFNQYKLIGSTMGSREELHEMLQFIAKHQITPIIDRTYELDDVQEAFNHLEINKQFGKIAINMV